MKPHTPHLRQKIYEVLKAAPRPLKPTEIANQLGVEPLELANSLRYMLGDEKFPDFWRKRNSRGWSYAAKVFADDSARPQHAIMQDLWRGWGSADRLGDGHAEVFFEGLRREL
jgi:hypothetical protein